jgi:cysteinyl-tRNA synthetase
MITKHLGYRVDICCGGVDNLFRHHDYNIAVIEAASGEEFCHYWVHGEHLLADGKKMSKSRGNIVYPDDLTAQGYSAQQVRFYLLYGHHRKQMNMTREAVDDAAERLAEVKSRVELLIRGAGELDDPVKAGEAEPGVSRLMDNLLLSFEERLSDDLDVKGAFEAVSRTVSSLLKLKEEGGLTGTGIGRIEENLRRIDGVLQVIFS